VENPFSLETEARGAFASGPPFKHRWVGEIKPSTPRINPIGGTAPIAGGSSSFAAKPVSGVESFAGAEAFDSKGPEAVGYIAMEPSGVMVYSEIANPSSLVESSSENISTDAGDTGILFNASPTSQTAITAEGDAESGIVAGFGAASSNATSNEAPISPDDLGIRNLQAFIADSDQGGHLSVSFEVPAKSATFWTAEASADSQSWTAADSIVSHQISAGSTPGFLMLTASVLEPFPSARHTQLRVKGKW
jgi:hypothetical protein